MDTGSRSSPSPGSSSASDDTAGRHGAAAIVLISVLIAVVAVIAATGIGRLHFNGHYSAYFDADDPILVQHETISRIYARGDAVFVVLASTHGHLLTGDHYTVLEDLTASLSALPNAASAVSVTELGIVGDIETDDGLLLPTLAQLREHDRAIGLLLSEDASVAGIVVEFELPDHRAPTVLQTLSDVRETVAQGIAGRSISAHYTGTLAMNEAYIEVVRHDLAKIVPLLLLCMVVALGFLLGSVRAVLAVLPVGIASVFGAVGIAGWLGAELAAVNTFVPVMILSISLAGCVHMALTYGRKRSEGASPADAAQRATRFNLLPMALANGTTALGFLALLLSPSPPIRVVGYMVASGIAVSFMLCMTLLPALLARLDPPRRDGVGDNFFLRSLSAFVGKRHQLITLVFVTLALPALWLVNRNVISDNVFEYFPASHPFIEDTRVAEASFSGINEALYSVDTGEPNGLFRVRAIDALDALASWLRRQPEVIRVTSISELDVLAEARNDGRLAERLANYERLVAENDVANPLVAREVSADYSSALVSVYLQQLDSAEIVAFDRRVHRWASENLDDASLTSGGPTLIFAYLGEHNIRSMLAALGIGLLFAAVVLGVALKSLRIAWTGLVCNFLPLLLVYSVWAVTNGRISIGAAIVMGMIIGIVIDDTIYLLSTYRRELDRNVVDPAARALRCIGPALIITTITLVAGLATGLLSDFSPVWSMSALSASTIAVALIVDLFLLPAMLVNASGSNKVSS